jgi:hypothetical protein
MSCIGIFLKINHCEGEWTVILHAMSHYTWVNKKQNELHLLLLLSLLFNGKNKNLLCIAVNIGLVFTLVIQCASKPCTAQQPLCSQGTTICK